MTLRFRQFFLGPLLLLKQAALGQPVLGERYGLVKVGFHKPVKLLIKGLDMTPNGFGEVSGGIAI
jgi:hypothetical protein